VGGANSKGWDAAALAEKKEREQVEVQRAKGLEGKRVARPFAREKCGYADVWDLFGRRRRRGGGQFLIQNLQINKECILARYFDLGL
jgi:hypothetical protein